MHLVLGEKLRRPIMSGKSSGSILNLRCTKALYR